jgi:hypoxanthine phosphoribosyltransferase
MDMNSQNISVLLSKEAIAQRVAELGAQISHDFQGQELVCVCILKGSVIFYSDLVRAMNLPVKFDFIRVSSYGASLTSQGDVKITKDLSSSIVGKNVLLIEDIVDTGITLSFLVDLFKSRLPKSLKVCSLLYKPARKVKDVTIDYLGFTIDNHYVVGYGMDASENFRNLEYVGIYQEPK